MGPQPPGKGEGLEIELMHQMANDLVNHAYVMKPQRRESGEIPGGDLISGMLGEDMEAPCPFPIPFPVYCYQLPLPELHHFITNWQPDKVKCFSEFCELL